MGDGKAVDTTGAGDLGLSGFLYGLVGCPWTSAASWDRTAAMRFAKWLARLFRTKNGNSFEKQWRGDGGQTSDAQTTAQ